MPETIGAERPGIDPSPASSSTPQPSSSPRARIRHWLRAIYPEPQARWLEQAIEQRLRAFQARHPQRTRSHPLSELLTQQDAILITYGDQFQQPDQPHLHTLAHFLDAHLKDVLDGVHILPFFPYSSDDGFAVIDYLQVRPDLGDWTDIVRLKAHGYRLMFDAVINHISRESAWFQAFVRDEAPYRDYFIVVDPETDLSQVVRPRALPLLTPVETASGLKYVWTTFSPDQIDLNYANPQVALTIIDVLLFYAEQGADILRLDAIAYLWKTIGTSCIHLPQTHAMVKLWRAIFDAIAPDLLLITETNVPHQENISYFGTYLPDLGKTDEAQLVYNFTLAPLTLHAFLAQDATRLARWASTLQAPPGATFFNFIASHDGIGVRPAEGILTPAQIQALVDRTLAHGGQVSYKANPDGSRSVYELNTTLYDFLNPPQHPDPDIDVARFLASQSILLSLAGVPGIYVHSLLGSRNCQSCYQATGRARSLNREKFQLAQVEALLADPTSHQGRVFRGYRAMLAARRQLAACHPFAPQRILDQHPGIFAVLRTAMDASQQVLCLTNVTSQSQTFPLPAGRWADILSPDEAPVRGQAHLPPYGIRWLVREG